MNERAKESKRSSERVEELVVLVMSDLYGLDGLLVVGPYHLDSRCVWTVKTADHVTCNLFSISIAAI